MDLALKKLAETQTHVTYLVVTMRLAEQQAGNTGTQKPAFEVIKAHCVIDKSTEDARFDEHESHPAFIKRSSWYLAGVWGAIRKEHRTAESPYPQAAAYHGGG